MMKNKSLKSLKLTVVAMLFIIGMTGCGNKIPELTEVQSTQIGEYAAVTLLKYDARHRSRLVDDATIEEYDRKQQELEELREQLMPDSEAEAEKMKPTEDTPTIDKKGKERSQPTFISTSEAFVVPEGITVSYSGYRACDKYPEDGSADGYFSLDASSGKKLLVLEFAVENTTGADVEVSCYSTQSSYKVDVGDGKLYKSMTTILLEDIATYKGTIPAGGKEELVLLFEVEQSVADAVTEIQLYRQNDSGSNPIQL